MILNYGLQKKPDRLLGFLTYKDKSFPFSYEEGVVTLMPPDMETWDLLKEEMLDSLFETSSNESKWIKRFDLYGETNTGKSVLFRVSENCTSENGFLSFSVHFLITYDKEKQSLDKIDSLDLYGDEIDYFSPPAQVFKSKAEFVDESRTVNSLSVCCESISERHLGVYTDDMNIISVTIQATPKLKYQAYMPLSASSKMTLTYKQPVNFETVVGCYFDVVGVLSYIAYRKNINIKKMQMISRKQGESNSTADFWMIDREPYQENMDKVKRRIIRAEYIGEKTAMLLEAVASSNLYLAHICNSEGATRSYDISRQILIFSAFEREYELLYGKKHEYSAEHTEAIAEIAHEIKKLIDISNGKKRKYFSDINRLLPKIDMSLVDKIKKVVSNHKELILPFARYQYKKQDVEMALSDLPTRMSGVRNNLVHGNFNYDLEPIILDDFKIIEILIYIMRLRKIQVDDKQITQGVSDLFGLYICV